MDFAKMSKEYEQDAAKIDKRLLELKGKLKQKSVNRADLNGRIYVLEVARNSLLRTAAELRRRGEKWSESQKPK